MSILFTNVTAVTMADDQPMLHGAYVAVDGTQIPWVGETRPEGTFDRVIDCTGKVMLPGLVNAHTHIPMALMRGYGGGHNLQDWLHNFIFPAEAKLDDRCVAAGTGLGLAELIASGVTCIADMYMHTGVIAEEIGMYRDSPEDMVTERLITRCFPGSLGRPVLGTEKTLESLTGASLRSFKEREYRSDRVVIALAGSFTEAHVRSIAERFSVLEPRKKSNWKKSCYTPSVVLKKKATEQNQLCLAWEGLGVGDERRFTWQLLSSIFGEGLSSRLFQTVREKYGLCYSVGSFTASFSDTGLFGISTGVSRDTERRALSLIMDEVHKLLDTGVTPQELERARELIKANLLMAQESTYSRMNRIGAGIMQLGSVYSTEEVEARYDAVTAENILNLAREMLREEALAFSAVGRLAGEEEYRNVLGIRS